MQTSPDEDEREGDKGSASWKADAPVLSSLIDGGISLINILSTSSFNNYFIKFIFINFNWINI